VLQLRTEPRAGNNGRLTHADWDAVGQLGSLTELHIAQHHLHPQEQQHFEAALRQLTRLESVGACAWTPTALAVLAGLPRLRCVGGFWLQGPIGEAPGFGFEHVTRLEHALLAIDRHDSEPFPTCKYIVR
jgi:hypothetical protein